MRIGFTGTRHGMTAAQRAACASLLARLSPDELHHGDAVGADREIHQIASDRGLRVIIHPPTNPSDRAFCQAEETRSALPYIKRNRAIVNETDFLLATPMGPEATARRSGTWRTVRYARQSGKPVVVVSPAGDMDMSALNLRAGSPGLTASEIEELRRIEREQAEGMIYDPAPPYASEDLTEEELLQGKPGWFGMRDTPPNYSGEPDGETPAE